MNTRSLVILSVAAALSTALSFLRLFEMPQGGSVTLDMLPIFYVAFWRGPSMGIGAGALSGVIQLLLRPFVVHPVQVLLDYPLAMAACGLAGFFRRANGERMLRTGLAVAMGAALVIAAGFQWLELNRISRTDEITIARARDVRTVVRTRPDSTFGDVEGTILTVRTREGGRTDTLNVISVHGESARRWFEQAMVAVRTEQLRWIGATMVLFAVLGGMGLLARYVTVGAVGLGVLVGSAAKFLAHLVSGVVFFAAYAPPGESVWVYSAAYNAAYLIPQAMLALLLLPPLLKRLDAASATPQRGGLTMY